MRAPTFSIIISNYNYGEFVGEAIESCLAQRYSPKQLEIIVVDDGSNDESRDVIGDYARRSPLIGVVHQKNMGQAAALKAGVAEAANDFVCFLDSDDVFHPDKLQAVANCLSLLPTRPKPFFLCHDASVRGTPANGISARTWFQMTGVAASAARRSLLDIDGHFQFSPPCGQVLSRTLAQTICRALPASDWKICADGPIAHAAALTTGFTHYLNTPLSDYRIHGRNSFSAFENGRFSTKTDWRKLWPKQLRFLRSYIDALELEGASLHERRDYLARMGRIVRQSSWRPVACP